MTALYELLAVQFAYDRAMVLDIDEFRVNGNTITAITGPNGCGKTTLLNLLAFLRLPTSGTLNYRGQPVNVSNWSRLRKRVSYVQQKPYLLKMSVRENIELGLKFRNQPLHDRRRRSAVILDDLGIAQLADRRAGELSGGEVQKVAIARALVLDPDVLILDEPFTHLDQRSVGFFESLITLLRDDRGKSVVFTSHDPIISQALSDRVYSMLNGRLVPCAMTNMYSGHVIADQHLFASSHLQIHIPEQIQSGTHLVIDPVHLVLSRSPLQSSMRNAFQGRIVALQEQSDLIKVTIDAGERFQAVITHEAMRDLDIHFGDPVWVSFKSSAVHVF